MHATYVDISFLSEETGKDPIFAIRGLHSVATNTKTHSSEKDTHLKTKLQASTTTFTRIFKEIFFELSEFTYRELLIHK